jgi:insertion element IS1 protein InsB
MAIEMTCPTCGSHDMAKNGMSHRGKQHYQCRDCRRQFVEDPQWQSKPKETKTLVNRVLHEKILLVGIARATGVSESWMQGHAHAVYEAVPQTTAVIPKPTGPLTVQMDELWSFADHQGNKQWVWLAIDAETQEILSSLRETALGNRRRRCGSPSQPSIVNGPRSIRTSGSLWHGDSQPTS